MSNNIRTHDKFYLDEDYKTAPKEYYRFVSEMIGKKRKPDESFSVIDVGCETGSFLHYIQSQYPNTRLTGMDIMEELIENLKKSERGIEAVVGNIETSEGIPGEKYDVVSMLGVISIFDDFRPVVDNLIDLCKRNGEIYMFGIFNPESFDVLIKGRESCSGDLFDNKLWEKGWNIWSKKSIELYLDNRGLKYEFIPWMIGIDIEKHNDPLRSWTFHSDEYGIMVMNGLQIVHNFFLLIIHK